MKLNKIIHAWERGWNIASITIVLFCIYNILIYLVGAGSAPRTQTPGTKISQGLPVRVEGSSPEVPTHTTIIIN